ncbi:hypothetical protein NDA11_001752 [Ustilago hordei]|nr:hypothetical protein NDA11_001752 [Ustilago hordei]KAJ1587254.1 hypothetical protein NDA15_003635 [Ustilago hordei]KAJ1589809.1 hypothetical protein NDA12_001146 [Ustilago hordei]KAJ1602308.1 hypothetical protein NDA14_004000 [Ustilago hordei]UTT96866.1 hypothetical protein NDA17_003098 [Ustilago hordei]
MAKWGMEDNGPVKEFLGISINQDRAQKRMSLNLSAYIKVMMKKHIRSGDICTWVSGQLEITCPKVCGAISHGSGVHCSLRGSKRGTFLLLPTQGPRG